MKNQLLASLIRQHFNFLITDYDACLEEKDSSICYVSDKFQIAIVRYRGDTVLSIAPKNSNDDSWLELGDIVTYKRGDKHHNYGAITGSDDESIVKHYSYLVKIYCDDMLNGDFSRIQEIKRYMNQLN